MNNFSGRGRISKRKLSTHYKDFGFAHAGNESGPLRGANGNASLSAVGNTVVISKGRFQEELDRCHRESELLIGEELSRFLVKVSEMEHLNQFLIRSIIQIFMVSFCESQWKPYFEQSPRPGKHSWLIIGLAFTYFFFSHCPSSAPVSKP
jgi:hypothetical protein